MSGAQEKIAALLMEPPPRRTKMIRDFDAVCTVCRWKGDHSPACASRDEPWPMVEVPDTSAVDAGVAMHEAIGALQVAIDEFDVGDAPSVAGGILIELRKRGFDVVRMK